jgi:plasmid maintenance system killer protein
VASLFNATCDGVRAPAVLASVTKIALGYAIPDSKLAENRLSGHHEFTEKGLPFFKLQTDKVNFGSVLVNVTSKMVAPQDASTGPNDLGSVPWLKLVNLEGDYKEVYRINTAGGVAPKTCEGIQGNFDVQYAAEYWFYV